jgi:hypothetical protein
VAQVTLYAVIFYFMVGFQETAVKFLVFWVTVQLFTLSSETFGVVCAIITPDSKVAVGVLSVLMIIFLSFSGYLVSWCDASVLEITFKYLNLACTSDAWGLKYAVSMIE